MKDYNAELREKLAKGMKRRKITRYRLAMRARLTPSTLQYVMENPASEVHYSTACRLLAALEDDGA